MLARGCLEPPLPPSPLPCHRGFTPLRRTPTRSPGPGPHPAIRAARPSRYRHAVVSASTRGAECLPVWIGRCLAASCYRVTDTSSRWWLAPLPARLATYRSLYSRPPPQGYLVPLAPAPTSPPSARAIPQPRPLPTPHASLWTSRHHHHRFCVKCVSGRCQRHPRVGWMAHSRTRPHPQQLRKAMRLLLGPELLGPRRCFRMMLLRVRTHGSAAVLRAAPIDCGRTARLLTGINWQ